MPEKATTKAQRDKLKDLLTKGGHDAKRVDGLKLTTERDLVDSVLALHGATREQLGKALGKGYGRC